MADGQDQTPDDPQRPAVFLKPRGAERIESGHPWVWRSDVGRAPEDLERGVVELKGPGGRFLGQALFCRRSELWVRLLTRERDAVDEAWFEARISEALERRAGLVEPGWAYRWIHGEADGLPGLFVDRYRDRLAVQILSAAMDQREAALLRSLVRVARQAPDFGPSLELVVLRHDAGARRHEGLERDVRCLNVGDDGALQPVEPGEAGARVVYREGGLEFRADLVADQKTGAFLDQRENRVQAREYARGRALDAFSFHGGFALNLARGGAEQVEAVEASEAACARIAENAERNGFEQRVQVTAGNVFDVLRDRERAGRTYDTIVLDPPALAKRKADLDAAYRGYKELNLRALKLVQPGGILISCSCSAHVKAPDFEAMLVDAAADTRRSVQVLERRGAGRDHPVQLGVPETEYLKCFVLRAL